MLLGAGLLLVMFGTPVFMLENREPVSGCSPEREITDWVHLQRGSKFQNSEL
ncbi:hypothetical protein [Pseudomonas cavernae]|uniref:hypothetical protein n=1 Tax=Pseudomonas cavernae TaxID=2320867 RepID=UPI0013C4DF09|nr:hypothetical protein [Pseudomonas cavernae]